MSQPFVVIVSGPPGTGKTTLAQRLAEDLRLPIISKDRIKEILFDTLGWSDREWSRRLGAATMELLYSHIESELAVGRSFVVECNFRPEHATARFLQLKEKYGFEPYQVQCWAEGEVLLQRFKQRAESDERHPGHVDPLTYNEVAPELLKGSYEPLDIGGEVVYVDTTDFGMVDYPSLLAVASTFTTNTRPPSNQVNGTG